jgi:hypothetical protein
MKSLKYIKIQALSLLFVSFSLSAQTVSTDPVGYVKLEVNPGNGVQKSTNIISLPLKPFDEEINGLSYGAISDLTANSIQVFDAGWTPGALSNPSTPYLLKILSGELEGLIVPISTTISNTANELFLNTSFNGEDLNLTSLNISTGNDADEFEITPADTLGSLFGTPETTGIIGGTNALDSDTIIIFSSVWNVYFYNTNLGHWVESTFGFPNAENVIIHPDSALIYERIDANPLTFTIIGSVPLEKRNASIKESGITFLSNGWPTDTILGESGIEQLPGWQNGSNASVADSVIIRSELGAWETFFYDGNEWKKSTFGFPAANDRILSLGSGIIINKLGNTSGLTQLTQLVPYL